MFDECSCPIAKNHERTTTVIHGYVPSIPVKPLPTASGFFLTAVNAGSFARQDNDLGINYLTIDGEIIIL
jgi:hypothetical protein